MTEGMGQRYRVKNSYYRFYDVKTGDFGRLKELRHQGESVCLLMERTGEEHWFRKYNLEPVEDPRPGPSYWQQLEADGEHYEAGGGECATDLGLREEEKR